MKGWKTFSCNLAVGLVARVTATFQQDAPVREATLGYIVAGTSAVNVILRALTTSPIFKD